MFWKYMYAWLFYITLLLMDHVYHKVTKSHLRKRHEWIQVLCYPKENNDEKNVCTWTETA